MGSVDFEFTPPPEAPVFEPTEEEFSDPLAFIAKIRPIAERAGICKIKPPPDWQPPFAVDVDNFKFTPRIQRLNELEAKTRIKLNFLDKIAKFWELQGSSLKIPTIERKALDLHTLHVVVKDEGGFDSICHERKWSRVATRLGYPSGRSVGSLLRVHYERILYPYDIFKSGQQAGVTINDGKPDCSKVDKDYIPHGIPSRQAIKPPVERFSRRSKRQGNSSVKPEDSDDCCIIPDNCGDADSPDNCANSELRKLQFYGAGPKMPGYSGSSKDSETVNEELLCSDVGALPPEEPMKSVDPDLIDGGASMQIDQIVCHVCGRGDAEESMLLCDGCDDSYHTFCLLPPLNEIPKGDWRCPRCIAKECYKPQECFGFEQAKKEFTLQSFGEMADQFKSDYFNMPVHMVPTSTVEKEFWRIVSAIDEDVTVQYGADLHTMEHGSGFPTKVSKNLMPGDEVYANSGWNLNILPVLEGSVLCHINADISGMKIPWMYVGMCFATFCWHNEDHWSYSINYLHWGEPKTWYGVPGSKAPLFEEAMKTAAPELFEAQPDLLHQLVTIMNPNILMKAGVPVYRTNQCAGEFVVTFPRAYHAGFNQGYNFAEAVNFCPSDWLLHGRNCIEHYSFHHRFCVFSHDELICKMAADPDSLDLHLAAATYKDMLRMVETEMKLRKSLMDKGIVSAEREAFELLPDDERQCDYCKTTCFLSAVTCVCTTKLVCMKHTHFLCDCPPPKRCLRFRYTLDELPVMLHRLKSRAESFDNWAMSAKKCLEAQPGMKIELTELKDLIREAEEKRFPDSDLLKALACALQEAEKCASVAQQLVSKRVRTRNRQSVEDKQVTRLTLDELQAFLVEVNKLKCEITEANLIKDLLKNVENFQKEATSILSAESPESKQLECLIDVGLSFDIDLPEVPNLQQKFQQVSWLENVQESLADSNRVTLEILRKLLDSGMSLPPHESVEKAMAEVQELLTQVEKWEEKAKICLMAKPHHVMSTLEAIVCEADNIPAYLPNTLALKDAMKKAREWNARVESIQSAEHYPYLDVLESVLNKGRSIPVRLEPLPQLESQVASARAWRDRTARIFLKKNSPLSLGEILSPRSDIGIYPNSKIRRKKSKESTDDDKDKNIASFGDVKLDASHDPVAFVNNFKVAEVKEIEVMRELRMRNLQKRAEDSPDSKYCVCRKGLYGMMLRCELCKDWFHANCVSLPKSATLKNKAGEAVMTYMSRDLKFLCPLCLRSRRPRLESILSILVSLQKLPVRLPEGEALQCLTERAMSWQDRARQSLATEELSSALAKLSVFSQRMIEQAAREKTEKIITSELLKAANNPDLQPPVKLDADDASDLEILTEEVSLPSAFNNNNNGSDCDVKAEAKPDAWAGSEDTEEESAQKCSRLSDLDQPQAFSTSEHAYSSASKPNHGQITKKHSRKSPLVPRQLETPVLDLSPMAKAQLEELMMEGDLLEVSLDETQHIWRILQACKPQREDTFPDFEGLESDPGLPEKEREVPKKRRLIDLSPGKKLRKIKSKLKLKQHSVMKRGSKEAKLKKLKMSRDENVISMKVVKNKFGKQNIMLKGVVKARAEKAFMKQKAGKLFEKKRNLSAGTALNQKSNLSFENRVKVEVSSDVKVERKKWKREKEAVTSDDYGEERCAATKCRRPTGEVNWVQCDGGCDLWFHLVCVGLNAGDVSESEDYICAACSVGRLCKQRSNDAEKTCPEFKQISLTSEILAADYSDVEAPEMIDIDDDVMEVSADTFSSGFNFKREVVG